MAFGNGSIFSMKFEQPIARPVARPTARPRMKWPTEPKIKRTKQKEVPLPSYLDRLARLVDVVPMKTKWFQHIELGTVRQNEWCGYSSQIDRSIFVSVLTIEGHHTKPSVRKTELVYISGAGYVCPNCGTSEYLRSHLLDKTKTEQARLSRERDQLGFSCAACGCCSK